MQADVEIFHKRKRLRLGYNTSSCLKTEKFLAVILVTVIYRPILKAGEFSRIPYKQHYVTSLAFTCIDHVGLVQNYTHCHINTA